VRYKKYPKYKDSGVEWLGDVPEGWIKTYLKYISNVNMGQSPSSTTYNNEGFGIEFLQGNADFGNIYPTARTFTTDAKKISKIEDILFTVRAPVGAMNISNKRYAIGRGLCAISSTKHSKKSFLWWLMPLIKMELDTVATGSTYEAVSVEQVNNSSVSLPPLKEQKAIANYLDNATNKIDTLIIKQKRLIELLKEKRQALISKAVTRGLDDSVEMKDSGVEWLGAVPKDWELWKVSHAFSIVGSGTTPLTSNKSYYNGHIPWVTTGELRENNIISTKKMLTNKALAENSSLRQFPIGSIVIAMYGATIGRLGILGIKATTNQACCVMTNSVSIDNKYLYYWLMGYKEEIVKLGYGGGQPNISQDTISNLKISAPSIKEQKIIINYLDQKTTQIDILIGKSTKAITLLQEKRTALISAVVTGKIDVRGEYEHT